MQTQRIESFQTIAISSPKRGWLLVWLIVLAIGVGLLLMYPIMRLGYVYQINYTEGWNVYHAKEAADGQPLYVDSSIDPFTPLDTPPLSFFLIGFLGKIIGSYLFAGRVISLLSLISIAILASLSLHLRGIHWKAGIFSGLSILALYAGYAPEYVGMNDPHFLGLSITVAGLWIYFFCGNTWSGLAVSTFVLFIGLFTTQNVFPALLAIGIDVFLISRKHGVVWIGFSAFFFFTFDLISGFHFGKIFWEQFKLTSGFSPMLALSQLSRFDFPFLFLALVAGWTALFAGFNPRLRFFLIYLGGTVFSGFYFSGGSTGNISLFFDIFLAIGLVLGISMQQINHAFQKIPVLHKSTIWLLPPLVTFAVLFQIPNRLPRANAQDLLASIQSSFQQDASFLKNQQGRVFCENLLLCYTAGKPLEIDALRASELAIRGETNENLALLMFESHQFSIIQLNRAIPENLAAADYEPAVRRVGALTQNMRIAIARNYSKDHQSSSGVFYKIR